MFYLCQLTGYDTLMSNLSNQPDQFETIRISHQAREILKVLDQERKTNSQILSTWLGTIGLGISRGSLDDLLDRLEKEKLVDTDQIENLRIVHLRQRGGEVASGVETLDWIARPELPG